VFLAGISETCADTLVKKRKLDPWQVNLRDACDGRDVSCAIAMYMSDCEPLDQFTKRDCGSLEAICATRVV
jgi:hypothetical protein